MCSNVFVAGIFYDFTLIDVPITVSINDLNDPDEHKETVKNIYFAVIGSEIFKKFLHRGVVVSYGDVLEEMVVKRMPSFKLCGIFEHYCIVISLNFHRPYIWTDSFGCRKELTNWSYVDMGMDMNMHSSHTTGSAKSNEVKKYVTTFEKMIKNSTKDAK